MRLPATRIIVFVFAGLIFLAALVLDTTALLQLAAYWIGRIPLTAWAVMLAATGVALFAARRRKKPARKKAGTRASTRRSQARPRKRGQTAPRRATRHSRPAR